MSIKTIAVMLDWVEANLEANPELTKLAAYVGYSSFYCSAKFREYVGISFREYVLKRKLSLAAAELMKTDDRILEIAVRYGFSSHEAFTRAFKRAYGCAPDQYRRAKPEVPLFEKICVL